MVPNSFESRCPRRSLGERQGNGIPTRWLVTSSRECLIRMWILDECLIATSGFKEGSGWYRFLAAHGAQISMAPGGACDGSVLAAILHSSATGWDVSEDLCASGRSIFEALQGTKGAKDDKVGKVSQKRQQQSESTESNPSRVFQVPPPATTSKKPPTGFCS